MMIIPDNFWYLGNNSIDMYLDQNQRIYLYTNIKLSNLFNE